MFFIALSYGGVSGLGAAGTGLLKAVEKDTDGGRREGRPSSLRSLHRPLVHARMEPKTRRGFSSIRIWSPSAFEAGEALPGRGKGGRYVGQVGAISPGAGGLLWAGKEGRKEGRGRERES